MTKRDLLKKSLTLCAFLVLAGNGPCQQRVDLNQSASPCTQPCSASQICVHYPSCSGGAGSYQCEDASNSNAYLCDNYPTYSLSSNPKVLECICPTGSDPGNGTGTQTACGQSVCTGSQVCVHYPACSAAGGTSEGCEANDPSKFATLCSNYGGQYTVDSGGTNVECVCPSQPATCGQSVCTASQVCVHYPACLAPGASTAGCESNDPSRFATLCSNYGGRYSVDNGGTNVDCLCQ